MDVTILQKTAEELTAPGKGIFAADATEGTMDKRMTAAGINPTPDLRREFREILLGTEGVGDYISGVILNDEIIRQKTSDGMTFVELAGKQKIIPGIKVDKKTHDMANFPGEKIAEGVDGLRERLTEYKAMGVRFAKFRSVITIGEGIPTQVCIDSNSEVQARYAALCQEQDILPIVEPEVLMEGVHNIGRNEEVTKKVLTSVFKKLADHKIFFKGMLLKPNVVHPGKESGENVDNEVVADKTLQVLRETVPEDVPGVLFLSGGDPADEMTQHLDLMNEKGPHPWELSFSFERALEGPTMEIWQGKSENITRAQSEFYKRARLNSLARTGKYKVEMEKENFS